VHDDGISITDSFTEKTPPSAKEIYQALPAEGLHLGDLINIFRNRVTEDKIATFIKRVKAVTHYDKDRGVVDPLPEMPSDEHINTVLRGPLPATPSANGPAHQNIPSGAVFPIDDESPPGDDAPIKFPITGTQAAIYQWYQSGDW
jgi:hypothetical protein